MTHGSENGRVRSRASRACQTCSQRKVRCDATEVGLPCSRCRVDKCPNCVLVASKRGTYPRGPPRLQSPYERVGLTDDTLNSFGHIAVDFDTTTSHDGSSSSKTGDTSFVSSTNFQTDLDDHAAVQEMPPSAAEMTGFETINKPSRRPDTQNWSTTATWARPNSITSMFEKFLDQQAQNQEDATKCGIIFMSGTSPLTFALEEMQRGNAAALHDAGSHFSAENDSGTVEHNVHPSHLSPHDINYLKLKGAFESPNIEILSALVTAFVERFCPLYSIVDIAEFERSLESESLPWILLHSVCFIGATFCDLSVIHRAGFKGRWHARRLFYDKAKVLFDIGYETNKIVLLQTVIMLSFWGPQMKSYWNPCSWVGFGVTIAESLGIHRLSTSTYMDLNRRSLLKRLFWTLAVRDAYCATLLGRPFRFNMSQCDTEILTLDDFSHGKGCDGQDHSKCQLHAHYQIQISKLSLILRTIVDARFGPTKNSTTVADLHSTLEWWQSELPSVMNWCQQGAPTDIFAVSLKIIFHLHLILIHLEKPNEMSPNGTLAANATNPSSQIADSAAQMISSTAFTIITNSMIGLMPHEIFSGFFVAGIVFYRGIRQPQDLLASLSRSALDNCQMVISEARERWDPALWVIRIFDFLLSGTTTSNTPAGMDWRRSTLSDLSSGANSMPLLNENDGSGSNNILHSVDFDSPTCEGVSSKVNDFFLMSNYLSIQNTDPSLFGF